MPGILLLAFVACASAAPSGDVKEPCYFDGHTYLAGETIHIQCLATMECLGDDNYGNLVELGGVCPEKREVDGQIGCLFDGRMYGVGEKMLIPSCLGEITCLGNYNLSPIAPPRGQC